MHKGEFYGAWHGLAEQQIKTDGKLRTQILCPKLCIQALKPAAQGKPVTAMLYLLTATPG